MIALVDCNNFFVSCERVFRPDLVHKPVAVLSSNDGCAIARSNEVKALGVPMGAPAFKYRDVFVKNNIVTFSANFELYGNMSRRITDILTSVTPHIEIYSVDESFLDLSELPITNYEEWGRRVVKDIWQWVGVPVSVGIAPTKTLAKVAVHYAKKNPDTTGGCSLVTPQDKPAYKRTLEHVKTADVWGVGWRNAPKLRGEGIFNAYQLSNMNPRHARQMLSIQGRQMVAELNGVACFPVQLEGKPAKSISRTRTFGQEITDKNTLRAAIADFASRACFRLRESRQLTSRASLFVSTNRFKPNYQYLTAEIHLDTPTNDTGIIISKLMSELNKCVPHGFRAYRAGAFLHDFTPESIQTSLLEPQKADIFDSSKRRMWSIDFLNERFGKDSVFYASKALGKTWRPRKGSCSPRYVTRWSELPEIHTN